MYANDSFKVRRNFTLNYGLRWEVNQPWLDTQNRLQAFVPGQQSMRYPDAPEGWVFAGDKGVPRTIMPTPYGDFAPRVGLAFSPDTAQGPLGKLFGGPGHTSIRAGFGIFYQSYSQLTNYWELGNAPFGLFWGTPTPVYLEQPFKDRIDGNDPGQKFPFVHEPNGATGFWAQFQPIGGEGAPLTNNRTPYMEQYNFNIQRQIGESTILTLAFVGSSGHHLMAQTDGNPGNGARCLQIAALMDAQGESGQACGPFGEDTIYNVSPGVNYYGTRPYSVTSGRLLGKGILDFTSEQSYVNWGNSNYNALQVTLEKRVGAVRLLGAYTWSKSIDDSSGFLDNMNPFNHELSRGPSTFNMAQNFVVSYMYDLPFQKALRSHHGPLYKILDGWQLSGITRFTTGFPIGFYEGDDRSLCNCEGVGQPDWSGQKPQFFAPRTSANHQYFATQQFSVVNLGQLGTAAPHNFAGPGTNNWDLALHKMTQVNERLAMEFRAEFFNAFNHAQFCNPNGNIDSGSFGQIGCAGSPRIGQVALKLTF